MSWLEVESKVHVKHPSVLRAKLKKIAKYKGVIGKNDAYYSLGKSLSLPKKKIRIRDKGKIIEVNYKESLSYFKGVHVKKETEFTISNKSNFIELLGHIGFVPWMTKSKKTELYQTSDRVNLELNYVKGLGWYLEIEILCRERYVKHAQRRIIELRHQLGFSIHDVEKRGYTRELWMKKIN